MAKLPQNVCMVSLTLRNSPKVSNTVCKRAALPVVLIRTITPSNMYTWMERVSVNSRTSLAHCMGSALVNHSRF